MGAGRVRALALLTAADCCDANRAEANGTAKVRHLRYLLRLRAKPDTGGHREAVDRIHDVGAGGASRVKTSTRGRDALDSRLPSLL